MPMLSDSVIWAIALIVFVIVEGITSTALVSVWFACGSLFALILSFFTNSITAEAAIFLIVSAISFALFRPIVKKHFNPKTEETNSRRLIGETAVVTQTVDNLASTGQVSLKGQIWTARAVDTTPIETGTPVVVTAIEGVKVIVTPHE